MLKPEQLESTIKMLALAAAQIEATMIEAGQSVSELSTSFSEIAEKFHHLDGHQDETLVQVSRTDFTALREQINQAIVAIQFYDRMTQRLHHVNEGLIETAELLENPKVSNTEWEALQETIKKQYTMESERQMFDQIVAGKKLDEALETFKKLTENTLNNQKNDVELF